MIDTRAELDRIMRELGLSSSDVAHELNVGLETVEGWLSTEPQKAALMPESELRLLQYSLMSENRRFFLF